MAQPDLHFKLDGLGRWDPTSENARRALAERRGEYALLPTSPDLLVFLRQPLSGGKSPARGTLLVGDASTFPLTDFIGFLAQSRFNGVLRVHAPDGARAVVFLEGEVRGASSESPSDRLGEVLIRLGYLDRGTIDRETTDVPPARLGRTLVEKGLLQPHDLWKALTEQTSAIFEAMVLCHDGLFEVARGETEELTMQKLQLSTQGLLMDSVRKVDELAHFRKRIPNGRAFVVARKASDGRLEEDEDRVLSLVNNERTVLDLGRAAKLSEFDVTKVVFRLLEGGYVQLSELGSRPPAKARALGGLLTSGPELDDESRPGSVGGKPSNELEEVRALVRLFNQIFREIRDEVAKLQMEREFVAAANAALAGQSVSTSPVLRGQRFEADGTLQESSVVQVFERARASLGSAPVASLRQALSDVMFFLLFHAGELLEPGADEALGRRAKELLGADAQGGRGF